MNIIKSEENSYSQLLLELKAELAEGLARAQLAYEREKIIAYWKVGESIATHLLANKDRAGYRNQLYKRLSEDLTIGERLLYQMTQFYNAYPNFEPVKNLKWSHYRILTSIKDQGMRNILQEKVSNSNLSIRKLEQEIKQAAEPVAQQVEQKSAKPKKLRVTKGKLYTYRVFKEEYTDNLLVDCGFNIYRETDLTSFNGQYLESAKEQSSYSYTKTTAKPRELYAYKAYVNKIIDGDTIWLNIDCGFKTWIKQKVRLRGIDTPSIETKEGQQAKDFVTKELKALPFVIIKSHGRDKYGRYLADIFYSAAETDPAAVQERGIYLNQRLLDEGLAVRLG